MPVSFQIVQEEYRAEARRHLADHPFEVDPTRNGSRLRSHLRTVDVDPLFVPSTAPEPFGVAA